MEVKQLFRPVVKLLFLTKAAFEVGRERVEDVLDAVTAKASEYKCQGTDKFSDSRNKVKEFAGEVYQQVWQRSEVLENQVREKLKRQVSDFSLGALGDSSEINELRAELATLRAELAEIKSIKTAV